MPALKLTYQEVLDDAKAVLAAALSALLWASEAAHAQAPFYQGKTIRVIVGTPPGNLYDLWARLIVEHMGKHIPGNPNFIVQNMPGAGHVVAVNHLYTQVAKPDGLTMIGSVIPSLYLNQLRRPILRSSSIGQSLAGSARRHGAHSQMYMRSRQPLQNHRR